MANRNLQWQQNQVSTRKKGLANYKIIREVESSPYQLFKARRIVDRLFCIIKRIDLSALTEEEKLLSFNEVKVLASLKCQYIVTCYDSFTEGNSLYVVVEYTHMGSLKKKLVSQRGKLLSERSVWKYFVQIAAAVLNMNQNSILHGSLQLQSIFLNSKDDIRLSNFGRAIRLSTSNGGNGAHPVRNRRRKGVTYNTKTEMLSLGCVLYELCTLKNVNDSRGTVVNGTSVMNGGWKINYADLNPISTGYSPELESLVKDLLACDASQRPTIQEIWTSPLVRNKALNSNVQMPKVFFPQLQVLNEMKHKYASGKRHWTRMCGQERNSRMGRNNFPLADAIRQIKWDNASNVTHAAGLELHDYNGHLQELQYANGSAGGYHLINGDINYRGSVHAQDLRTKVESDWIGQKRAVPEAPESSNGAMAIMRKANGHGGRGGKSVMSPKGAAHKDGRRRLPLLKDELDNWMASKENNSQGDKLAKGKGRSSRQSEKDHNGGTKVSHVDLLKMRQKKERENHKLDRCLKFLVMGPIGPWSDNDDFMKNEFNDYVARSIAQL